MAPVNRYLPISLDFPRSNLMRVYFHIDELINSCLEKMMSEASAIRKNEQSIHESNSVYSELESVFSMLNEKQIDFLVQKVTIVDCEPGRFIFREGDDNDQFIFLQAGVVKLIKGLSDGRQQIVGLKFAPSFAGFSNQRVRTVSAQAATACRLFRIPEKTVEGLVAGNLAFGRFMLEQCMREIEAMRELAVVLGRMTAQEKLASFLLMLADMQPRRVGGREITLPLSRMEIADYLGLTIETISREISGMKRRKILSVACRRNLAILDHAALTGLSVQ